jgi:hypothetical protein
MGGGKSESTTTTVSKLEAWSWREGHDDTNKNPDPTNENFRWDLRKDGNNNYIVPHGEKYLVEPHGYAKKYLRMAYEQAVEPRNPLSPDYMKYRDVDGIGHPFQCYGGPNNKDAEGNQVRLTYAALTTRERLAICKMAARGRQPVDAHSADSVLNAAIGYCNALIKGEFVDGNHSAFQELIIDALGGADFTYARTAVGNGPSLYYIGSPGGEGGLGRNLAANITQDHITKLKAKLTAIAYADNWEKERAYQTDALNYTVELGKQSVFDAELLRMSGLIYREWNQGDIENRYKFWYEDQVGKVRRLEMAGNGIRGLVGTVETTTKRSFKSGGGAALGIAGTVLAGVATIATGGAAAPALIGMMAKTAQQASAG